MPMSVEQLTDLKLRKLKPDPQRRREIWDARIPGFGVRVAPSGTKTFILMYRLHDRKRRISIGRYPEMGLADARRIALEKRAQVARNEDPNERNRPHDFTFESVLLDFLELHCKRHNKPSTYQATKRHLENECLPAWRGHAVADIRRKDIIAVLDAIVARGHNASANNAYAAMSKFFNWCASRDLIKTNPCIGVERPAKRNSRDRVLSDNELSAISSAAATVSYPFGHIIKLLMLTGQRRGEVTTMQWDHLNWDAKLWHIPEELTKNGRPHTVPLSDPVLAILKSIPSIHERFVFPARGSTTTCFSGFGKCKERLDTLLSINPWRLHDLRRTAATGMAQLQVQPHIVERVLNHATGQLGGVAGIYNRFQYIDEMRDALNRWAAHVESLEVTT